MPQNNRRSIDDTFANSQKIAPSEPLVPWKETNITVNQMDKKQFDLQEAIHFHKMELYRLRCENNALALVRQMFGV